MSGTKTTNCVVFLCPNSAFMLGLEIGDCRETKKGGVEYRDWDSIKLGPGPLVLVFWDPVPSLKHRYSVLCVVATAL